MRILGVVDGGVDDASRHRGLDPGTFLDTLDDRRRDVAIGKRIGIVSVVAMVAEIILLLRYVVGDLRGQVFGDRQAEADGGAVDHRSVLVVGARLPENIEARGYAAAE